MEIIRNPKEAAADTQGINAVKFSYDDFSVEAIVSNLSSSELIKRCSYYNFSRRQFGRNGNGTKISGSGLTKYVNRPEGLESYLVQVLKDYPYEWTSKAAFEEMEKAKVVLYFDCDSSQQFRLEIGKGARMRARFYDDSVYLPARGDQRLIQFAFGYDRARSPYMHEVAFLNSLSK
jgi:hypothetical protein